jgi:hypothetical protein
MLLFLRRVGGDLSAIFFIEIKGLDNRFLQAENNARNYS